MTTPTAIPPLASLGPRIMILGPTNAGKSTLAAAIGNATGLPVHHVDLMRHLPNTDWEQRSDADFHALHAAAIAEPSWVMEGNYSAIIPPRVARATGILVIDDTLAVRTRRYFWRTLFSRARVGALEGQKDSVKWEMVHWLWKTRNTTEKYRRLARESGLPYVFVHTSRDLRALYAAWSLERPAA